MTDEPIRLGDRYELGGLLGKGGMADVRVARDLRLGRTVAVKQLRADLSRDDTFQERFRREAQSAAALNHPAIVAVYDTGDSTDRDGHHIPYIVMEYVEGQTLRQILRDDRKILPERSLSITADVLSALDYSHRSGIIHRDIKPANVMLTPTGQVKVMDFGIARAIADSSSAMTQTAAVIGTAQYLSPEQARGEQVDARSDIYSAGCLLYELLTGRPPFVGDSPVSVAYQHVREEARPPSALNPDIPTAIDHIVAKSLAKRVEDRYQSAADMRRDIERALHGHHVDAPTAATAVVPGATRVAPAVTDHAPTQVTRTVPAAANDDDRRGGGSFWPLLLGLLLVGGLALAGWLIYENNKPEPAVMATVPSVAGKDVETATRAIENAGLVVGGTTEATSADVKAGLVISTDPPAGESREEGSSVDLVVSSGPEQVSIPSLTGWTFDDAKKLLEGDEYKLKVKKSEQQSSEPADRVINSNPPAGQQVDVGSTITLFVSIGQVTVPDVVGDSIDAAAAQLEQLGLKVKRTPDADAVEPNGQVISQSLPAGQQVAPNTTIELTYSTNDGLPDVEVPDGEGG